MGAEPAKGSAIVVGASSGIGRALALRLARDGWTLGLAGRRVGLLESLREEIGAGARVQEMDVADVPAARAGLETLITEMGGADLVVVNAGTGSVNPDLAWELEEPAIRVNALGFAAMANVAMRHFLARGRGHLVGISSLNGLRGSRHAPAYSASKAFVSNYLEGLSVSPTRFTTMGYGESQPIADNESESGRQANRRVELAIMANDKLKKVADQKAGQ